MKIYSDDSHIQAMIKKSEVLIVDQDIPAAVESYLLKLPWLGTGLDWSKIDHTSYHHTNSDREAFERWLKDTSLGAGSHIGIFFSSAQISLACAHEFFMDNLDQIFWKAPGRRFLFAVNRIDSSWEPLFENFAEFDGNDTFMAVSR